MKRQLKLLILVGVLILCVVGYAVVSMVGEKADTDNTTSDTSLTVTDFAANDVATIRWVYEGESYELIKTDSVWYNQEDKNFPVAQSYISTMSSKIASMTASRKIENVTDFTQYGLDEPQIQVTVITSSGGEISFILGDTNNITNECYMQYTEGATFGESSDVYLVSSQVISAFSYSMDDLIQYETLPDMSEITSVKIEANETYRISYMGEDASLPWILRDEEGSKRTANTTLCEELSSALSGMGLADCVDFDAAKADLSVYGLDEPWANVTVEYSVDTTDEEGNAVTETETFSLSLGNVDENGYYYMLSEDFSMLYAITPDIAEWIKSNNTASITDISDML